MVKHGETGPSVSETAEECATSLEAKLSQIDMELILSKDAEKRDAVKFIASSNHL